MKATALVKQKRDSDKAYWKERRWEAKQLKKKEALDEAVRRLNSRTDDEVGPLEPSTQLSTKVKTLSPQPHISSPTLKFQCPNSRKLPNVDPLP